MKTQKVHAHLVDSVVEALNSIFIDGYYADKVIERSFKLHPKWGGRDRRFFAESVYEIVRWKRLLYFCIDQKEESLNSKTFKNLFAAWWVISHKELPEKMNFQGIHVDRILDRYQKSQSHTAVRESIPDWIYDLGKSQLGEQWERELSALNQKAPVVLRANTLLISRDELKERLSKEDVICRIEENAQDALVLIERKNVFATECFKKGFFEVQDASSQLVASFMKLQPGLRVIDACAGAGGKSLHIAALLKNKGKVISMDVEERKLLELKKRAARAKVDVIETKLIEGTKTIKRLDDSADRVLLDVPCSGLGVLKRNPDSKWKFTQEKYKTLLQIQKDILGHYSKMTKKGGYLVYSTCSLLPSENREQIDWFLGQNPLQWELEEQKEIYPSIFGYDGFFMARLKRL